MMDVNRLIMRSLVLCKPP